MWVLEKFSYLAGTLLEYSYLYYLGTTQEIVIKGGELIDLFTPCFCYPYSCAAVAYGL